MHVNRTPLQAMFALFGVLALAATLAAVALDARAEDKPQEFRASLSGEAEVPAVETDARGEAMFRLLPGGKAMRFRLEVSNIQDVNVAHIHLGAPSENGPHVAFLYPSHPPPVVLPGKIEGVLSAGLIRAEDLVGPLEGKSVQDLVAEIRAGTAYVNVHSKQAPEGEIRGPIR